MLHWSSCSYTATISSYGLISTVRGALQLQAGVYNYAMAVPVDADELTQYIVKDLEGLHAEPLRPESFGWLHRVTVNGSPCIAKRLHDVLAISDVSEKEKLSIRTRFRDECLLLSKLRHPNIAQFIGVHFGRQPDDWSLVIEGLYLYLDEVLAEHAAKHNWIMLSIQLAMLLDVARGLHYLHSQTPLIVHRSLVASNVMLTESMSVKLTDLGVSRMMNVHPLTRIAQKICPTALGAMPPEALMVHPVSDGKLDSFSFGTLMLHTVNYEFPEPSDIPEDCKTGEVEITRRLHAVTAMGEGHCLYPLVCQCLQDEPKKRPSAAQISLSLEQLTRKHPKEFDNISEVYSALYKLREFNGGVMEENGVLQKELRAACMEVEKYKEELKKYTDVSVVQKRRRRSQQKRPLSWNVSVSITPPQSNSSMDDVFQFGAAENHSDDGDWITEAIELEKGEVGGLGFGIAGGIDNPSENGSSGIFITKFLPNTPAERNGRLQSGDQLLSVNGFSLASVRHMQAVNVLKDAGKQVSLVVRRKRPFVRTPVSELTYNTPQGSPQERKSNGAVTPTRSTTSNGDYPQPVIILGPLRKEIKNKLMQKQPHRFAECIPHTTRSPREGEVDGRDYHFVSSVEQMERDIRAHLFIQAGWFKDNLYGTGITAIQEVARQGKHCILDVSGNAIRQLKANDFHPIAICIRPTSISVIQSALPKNSEEQCKQIFEKGRQTEQDFAEHFTAIVDGDSLTDIYSKVKRVIKEQSGDTWVPSDEPVLKL